MWFWHLVIWVNRCTYFIFSTQEPSIPTYPQTSWSCWRYFTIYAFVTEMNIKIIGNGSKSIRKVLYLYSGALLSRCNILLNTHKIPSEWRLHLRNHWNPTKANLLISLPSNDKLKPVPLAAYINQLQPQLRQPSSPQQSILQWLSMMVVSFCSSSSFIQKTGMTDVGLLVTLQRCHTVTKTELSTSIRPRRHLEWTRFLSPSLVVFSSAPHHPTPSIHSHASLLLSIA